MKTYLIQFDFKKYQPSNWQFFSDRFGAHNEGFIVQGIDSKSAIDNFNKAQLPGYRLNAWYLKVTEIKNNA